MNPHSAVCCEGDKPAQIQTPLHCLLYGRAALCRRDGFDFVDVHSLLREEDKDCRTAKKKGTYVLSQES